MINITQKWNKILMINGLIDLFNRFVTNLYLVLIGEISIYFRNLPPLVGQAYWDYFILVFSVTCVTNKACVSNYTT